MFDELCDKNNFGKYLLAVESSENDGDHYETNIEWFDEFTKAVDMYRIFNNAAKDLPFTVAGHTLENLQDLANSETKNEEGFYISDYMLDLVGGYQYDSSIVRVAESVKLYILSPWGVLEKCNVPSQ